MIEIKKHMERLEDLKKDRSGWDEIYTLISKYVRYRRQGFSEEFSPGSHLVNDVFDSTAASSNFKMASSLVGAMWPGGAKTLRLSAPDGLPETKETKDFYAKITEAAIAAIDHGDSGFRETLQEHFLDQGGFGISGVGVFRGTEEVPLKFQSWSINNMYVDEGANQKIDTIYKVTNMTNRTILKTFGKKNADKRAREAERSGTMDEKREVVHALTPRKNPKATEGALAMPVESIHFLPDTKHKLKESGFDELPVRVVRFAKAIGEIGGWSPSRTVMPDILSLNAIWEILLRGAEKRMDPPLGVFGDSMVSGQTLNTSAGAVNGFSMFGIPGSSADMVFPIQTVGDSRGLELLIEKRTEAVKEAFMLDILLDFNNQSRMTAFEANLRNDIRGQALMSIFARQESELFIPTIDRSVGILLSIGSLGVVRGTTLEREVIVRGKTPIYMPDSIAKLLEQGLPFYKIEFLSPAKRLMRAAEAQGILATTEFVRASAEVNPDVIDTIDYDKAAKVYAELTGSPSSIIRPEADVKKLREDRQKQQAEAQKLEAAKMQAETNRAESQSIATMSGTDQNTEQL